MEKSFSSLAELRAEIDFLKVKQFKEEEKLKEQISSPSAIFRTVTSLFRSESSKKPFLQNLLQDNLITNVTKFILPLFLNGVVFKKSGFITKTLIALISQKAAKQIDSDMLAGLVDKVTGMFKHKNGQARKSAKAKDYGIPPDSETY